MTEESAEDETFAIDADGGTTLPVVDVLTGRGFVTGKSGSGKSNSVSVVAEELLERSHPLLIVDTDGEYYGLKEQYEVLHAGADEECDIRVGPEHADKLATLALEQHVPIVLDVSGFLDEETARELIQATARTLFAKEKKLRRPFLLVIEEIHEYIPESGGLDECGQQLIQIAKRGRKHGLGIVGVSQRPANVKKDFITQANWLLWHRLTWDNDTKVVRRVIDREHADAVADLDNGEGFLMADWAAAIQRVQLRQKETFDAGATPGLEDVERPDLKSVSDDLVDELQTISDEQDRYESELERVEREAEQLREEKAEMEDQLETAREVNVQLEGATASVVGAAGDSEADSDIPTVMIDEADGEGIGEVASVEAINVEAMDVGEIRQHAQNQAELIEDLHAENDNLHERVEDLTARAEQAEQTVAEQRERIEELEEYERLYERRDELEEAIRRAGEALDIDLGKDAEQYREQLQAERERVEELEATVEQLETTADSQSEETETSGDDATGVGTGIGTLGVASLADADLTTLLQHEAIQTAIQTAADRGRAAEQHYGRVLGVLVSAGNEEYRSATDVAALLDVSDATVRDVLKQLHTANVVTREAQGRGHAYALTRDLLEQRIEVAEQQAAVASGPQVAEGGEDG
jgi:hypothetical protein